MPKMTMRVILKSGSEFAIKCDKFTITRNGFGQATGYNIEGITENKPVYLDFEQVAAVVRVYSDEKEGGGGEYLWRWKRKNGEEDLQKAIWYINRIIDRAGKLPEERKGLFNMTENKHGFMPKQEITIGGIAFAIIQTAESWVKCIASECVGEGAFDAQNRNDFAASDIREFLNGEFLHKLIAAGAPEAMFEYFNVDLTADDGLKDYGGDRVRVGLITCDEYRLLRGNIPELPNTWWWTATPDSPKNPYVRYVNSDGTLDNNDAYNGSRGVRPLCVLKSEILKSYLDGDERKRAEAVDMMKHIAAAWNIKPEEVFGEGR